MKPQASFYVWPPAGSQPLGIVRDANPRPKRRPLAPIADYPERWADMFLRGGGR